MVCVSVAMIQTRAGHLGTLQLLREVRVGLSLGSCAGVYLPQCVLAALRPFGRAGFGVKESQEKQPGKLESSTNLMNSCGWQIYRIVRR